MQKEEYENHSKKLTEKYTDQPVIANCTVVGQINVTDGAGTSNKRGRLFIVFAMDFSEDIKKGYNKNDIEINRQRLQSWYLILLAT